MKLPRRHDDSRLDAILGGYAEGGDAAAERSAKVVRVLRDAAAEPPPSAVEQRHLVAIAETAPRFAEAGRTSRRVRGLRGGGARVGGLLAGVRPAAVALKLAAVLAATMAAATTLALAGVGLPDPARAALEGVGVPMPDEDDSERDAEPGPPAGVPADPNPATLCAAERREDPDRFAERYGTAERSDAYGRCVSEKARRGRGAPASRGRDEGEDGAEGARSERRRAPRSRGRGSAGRARGAGAAAPGRARSSGAAPGRPSSAQRGPRADGPSSDRGRAASSARGRPSFAGRGRSSSAGRPSSTPGDEGKGPPAFVRGRGGPPGER